MSDWERASAQLCDPSQSAEVLHRQLCELREHLDVVYTPDYALFLKHMVPAFVTILSKRTRPAFEDNTVHRFVRHFSPDPPVTPTFSRNFPQSS